MWRSEKLFSGERLLKDELEKEMPAIRQRESLAKRRRHRTSVHDFIINAAVGGANTCTIDKVKGRHFRGLEVRPAALRVCTQCKHRMLGAASEEGCSKLVFTRRENGCEYKDYEHAGTRHT